MTNQPDNSRGSFAPHVPCNCVDCALRHGDQADPDDIVLDALQQKLDQTTAIVVEATVLLEDAEARIARLVAERDALLSHNEWERTNAFQS